MKFNMNNNGIINLYCSERIGVCCRGTLSKEGRMLYAGGARIDSCVTFLFFFSTHAVSYNFFFLPFFSRSRLAVSYQVSLHAMQRLFFLEGQNCTVHCCD